MVKSDCPGTNSGKYSLDSAVVFAFLQRLLPLFYSTRSLFVDTRSVFVDTRSLFVDTRSLFVDTRSLIIFYFYFLLLLL